MSKKKITIPEIKAKKLSKDKFNMITVYDFPMASIVDRSIIEMILVGDSLGTVIQGLTNTLSVNLEDIIYHLQLVRRGAPNTFIVGDMPFLSYQVDRKEAIRNAGILLQNGADCVKMEGGMDIVETVRTVVKAGIPVIAHIGLTPSATGMRGNFKVEGNNSEVAQKLLGEARSLEDAGAFAIVLQCLPSQLAKVIDKELHIPTIGYGSGPHTSAQNLNAYALLGIVDKFVPKFVKQYVHLYDEILRSFDTWHDETEKGTYPASEHCFDIEKDEFQRFY